MLELFATFPLYIISNTLKKSKNNSVALKSFALILLMI